MFRKSADAIQLYMPILYN